MKWDNYIAVSDEMKIVIANRKQEWIENEFKDEMMRRKGVELLERYDNQDKEEITNFFTHF